MTNIVDIGTSGGTHFILDSNNKVFACGGNAQGEVGDNTTTNKSYYVEVKSKYGEALTNNIVKLSSSMARTNSSTNLSPEHMIRADGSVLGIGKIHHINCLEK